MDDIRGGQELNQLARLLFDSASGKWYTAMLLELAAGILVGVLGVLDLPGDLSLFGAMIACFILLASYVLRLQYDAAYDAAETMRRQSVLTEALGWPISRVQMSEWREQAGKRIRTQLKNNPREADYYFSSKEPGPERLAEMMTESAFYTRHIYRRLRSLAWIILAATASILVLVTTISLTRFIPDSVDVVIARVVYSVIPVLLAIDLLGWALKLSRHIQALHYIEDSLERLMNMPDVTLPQVLRLLSEYNCQVAAGIPIHNRVFNFWRNDIHELWNQRQK